MSRRNGDKKTDVFAITSTSTNIQYTYTMHIIVGDGGWMVRLV